MKRNYAFAAAALAALIFLSGCENAQAASRTASASLSGASVAEIMESATEEITDDSSDSQSISNLPAEDTPQIQPLSPEEVQTQVAASAHDGIDIDLTRMSSTMVYGQVSGMMYTPDDYVGKTIRMRGESYSEYYDYTDTTYYSILIADATACCAQGVEYLLSDSAAYPEDGSEATVTGVFELYEELGVTYCRLGNASVQ